MVIIVHTNVLRDSIAYGISSVSAAYIKNGVSKMINYLVVINQEEQYSIWPEFKSLPMGWKTIDKQGSKEECLAYIKEVWSDMRPKSLREIMDV